jgi:pimeloyl-ACP methyl ester carboxylesterase
MPTMKINDINMYYELRGEGEPIVLIAGLGTDISPYREIIRRLSQKYKVLAFDNRGVGRTDKPDIPYIIEMMAEDTAGLLKETLPATRINVLGISMGGRIAMELALQHPELVKGLVLTSTSPRVTKNAVSSFSKSIKWIRASSRILGRSPQPYYAFTRQLKASRSYDCTNRLDEIRAPTLILHGKKDKLAPYELAEEMHTGIKSSKMITFKGGHMFFFWETERFIDTILEFLGSID